MELLAPGRRFSGARSNLTSFARTGDVQRMRSGVRHYVSTGYGGSANLSRRLAGTGRTARNLSGVLDPSTGESLLDRKLLSSRSAEEVMDAVVEAARPHDGTQDAESAREAIRDALADVLERFNDADLLALTDEQRRYAIESFTAHDVYRRFQLDVGKHLLDKAPSKAVALARFKQVRAYIKETVAEAFRKVTDAGAKLSTSSVQETVRMAMSEALRVFEEYVE
ncbi:MULTISPECIES: Qat anti-phage system associated protein QatB [unclassified Aeromicrobium]|uniref:Qat anti-phage system associated protein QatB n=1 Tax=unclassified Aeromicrobium TaxID=2633570 RepID=UPI00396AFF35